MVGWRHSAASLALSAALLAAPGSVWADGDWADVESAAVSSGLSARAVHRFLERCREHRMSVDDGAEIVRPLQAGVREGLPAEALLEKAQEGVTKGMSAAVVAAAVERRRVCLAEAQALAAHSVPAESAGRSGEVVSALGLAIESGLAPEAAAALLAHAGGRSAKQLVWVAEAGEALVLSGFSAEDVGALMIDYLQRDLGRSETLRAVRYACDQRHEGAQLRDVRRGLWGKGAGEAYGNTYGAGPRSAADGAGSRAGASPGQVSAGGNIGSEGSGSAGSGEGASGTQGSGLGGTGQEGRGSQSSH
jgi:hypothetical protein